MTFVTFNTSHCTFSFKYFTLRLLKYMQRHLSDYAETGKHYLQQLNKNEQTDVQKRIIQPNA